MAVITPTNMTGQGERAVTFTTLGASDTFVYNADKNPVLIIDNVTVGAITPNIDGASGTTINVPGYGSVSVASGYTTGSIAAGARYAIPLVTIREFLKGTITVTGGDGAEVALLEF